MFVFSLESLVLRGVSVLCGGKAVNLRLGFSVEANSLQPAAIGNSMCPAQSDYRPDTQPAARLNHAVSTAVAEPAVEGAGRSPSADILQGHVPATTVRRIASPLGAPAAGLFAGIQEKRSAVGSAWRMPAGRTPPTTTRGTRGR
jgi:hypothetical protein